MDAKQRKGKQPHSCRQPKGSMKHTSVSTFFCLFCSEQLPFQMMGDFSLIASLPLVVLLSLRKQDTVPLPASPKEPRKQAEMKSLKNREYCMPCTHTVGKGTFRGRKKDLTEKPLLWDYTGKRDSPGKDSNLKVSAGKSCPQWNFPN